MGSITRLMEAPVTIVLGVLAATPVWGCITAVPTATIAVCVRPLRANVRRRGTICLSAGVVIICRVRKRKTVFITFLTEIRLTVAPPNGARMRSRARIIAVLTEMPINALPRSAQLRVQVST